MNAKLKLIYPTINLFLYDLRDGLGDSQDAINQRREKFWRRLPNGDRTLTESQNLEDREGSYIELLPKQYQPLPDANGYYYPVKLNDTYALQIDCSANPQGSKDAYAIAKLKESKQIIRDRHTSPATLGETWLIWGKLEHQNQDPSETAKECYRLFSNDSWQLEPTNRGTFKKAHLFEISRFSTPSVKADDRNHIIICLFPADYPESDLKRTIPELYRELMQFFSYYHKINWIYQTSRSVKQDLKKAAIAIQAKTNELPHRVLQKSIDLQQLQQDLTSTLTLFSVYASSLSTLEEYKYAIAVNLNNYNKRLTQFTPTDGDERSFLFAPFRDYALEKYQPQITTDYNSASASLTLLENTIKTLEGIVQLEQAKRDRNLNETIFIVSAGIGTASASASAIAGFAEQIIVNWFPPRETDPLSTGYLFGIYSFSLILSILVGLGFSGVMGLVMKFMAKIKNR
ncbi:MAG: hypothetical protein AAGA60_17230 [Cyanobacteria bacterium P01_E01_bin.42]